MMNGRVRMAGYNQTTQDLAAQLTTQVGRPVMDQTNLQGKYDFVLAFSSEGLGGASGPVIVGGNGGPPPIPDASDSLPDLFSALQAQLGLKLDSKKGSVEMIVVDHLEKTPTGN